jgi:hypothetical protein
MNQVPWRRILERAGDEGSGERGASVINLRDHAPARQQAQTARQPAGAPPSDLESELKQALDRAQRKEREHVALRPPPQRSARREPPEMRSAPMLRPDLAMKRHPSLAVPTPPQQQQKTSSGARNFLAISLSAAVIGFAFYQIGDQWKEINDGPKAANSSADVPDSFAAVVAGGSGIRVDTTPPPPTRAQPRTEFEGNRINLRPSFAGEAGTAPARSGIGTEDTLDRDIAEAAKLISKAEPKRIEAAAVATTPAVAVSEDGMEQTMLRRGHDMVKQGRVESARLLFEHLAEQKSALGAFALAQTYDSKFLTERGISSVTPDQTLAAEWYQRAAELTMAGTR